MKKLRKSIAIILSLSMVITGLAFTNTTVSADEPTITDLANAIANGTEGIVNYAYGKKYKKSSNVVNQGEGKPTDGIISEDNYLYLNKNRRDQFVYVDLAEIYNSDGFDKVAVWFSGQEDSYPVEEGVVVEYTADLVEWHEIASIDQDEFDAQKGDAEGAFGVMIDVSQPSYQYARYVRVRFPASLGSGKTQYVSEVGVFDLDGDVTH